MDVVWWQKVLGSTLWDKNFQSPTKSCSEPHGNTFCICYRHFVFRFDNYVVLIQNNTIQYLLFQVSSLSASERGLNVSVTVSDYFISCFKQFNFCQFLFMSSLCKLSFHPEMEFSFMLKLLLSFCQLGELSCPPQSPQPNLCKITWTLELKLNCLSYCLFSIFFCPWMFLFIFVLFLVWYRQKWYWKGRTCYFFSLSF